MKRFTRTLKVLAAAVMLGGAAAGIASETSPAVRDGQGINDIVPQYDSIRRLPIDGIQMIEMGGRTIFTSTNGRFVFMNADLYDSWSRKHLKTPSEIAEYASIIDMQSMKLSPDVLGAFKVGTGSDNVTIFVDPQCPYCAELLSDATNKSMLEKYTFNVVVIPILGESSGTVTRNLFCAYENGELDAAGVVRALAKKDYDDLTPSAEMCDNGAVQRALVTAKMFGAQGVPFLINPKGRYVNSVPSNLDKFLQTGVM